MNFINFFFLFCLWNFFFKLFVLIFCFCGNVVSVNGKIVYDVIKINFKFNGVVYLGFFFSYFVFWNFISVSVGMIMIGDEFSILFIVVFFIVNVVVFWFLFRFFILEGDLFWVVNVFLVFWDRIGKMLMLVWIFFLCMRKMLRVLVEVMVVKGMRWLRMRWVEGVMDFRWGMRELRFMVME